MYHDLRDLGSLILIRIILKERNHRKENNTPDNCICSIYIVTRYKWHSSFFYTAASEQKTLFTVKDFVNLKKQMNVYLLQSSIPLTLIKIQK